MNLRKDMVQITTRLVALTPKELLRALNLQGNTKRSTFYHNLLKARSEGLIRYASHPQSPQSAITGTDLSRQATYGTITNFSKIRPAELWHISAVSSALINLSNYENLKGFLNKHEMDNSQVSKYFFGRKPDAILKMEKENTLKFYALEVRSALFCNESMSETLEAYEKTFNESLKCSGVIVCVPNDYIRLLYLKEVKESGLESAGIHVATFEGLKTLDPNIFGESSSNTKIQLKFDYRSFSFWKYSNFEESGNEGSV